MMKCLEACLLSLKKVDLRKLLDFWVYKPLGSHHLPKCCRKLDLRSLKEVVMVLPFDDSIAMRNVNKNAVMCLEI